MIYLAQTGHWAGASTWCVHAILKVSCVYVPFERSKRHCGLRYLDTERSG